MSFEEKIIQHIRKITGNPNAGLWKLQFDPDDIDAKPKDFSSPYFQGMKIRTNEDVKFKEFEVLPIISRIYNKSIIYNKRR